MDSVDPVALDPPPPKLPPTRPQTLSRRNRISGLPPHEVLLANSNGGSQRSPAPQRVRGRGVVWWLQRAEDLPAAARVFSFACSSPACSTNCTSEAVQLTPSRRGSTFPCPASISHVAIVDSSRGLARGSHLPFLIVILVT